MAVRGHHVRDLFFCGMGRATAAFRRDHHNGSGTLLLPVRREAFYRRGSSVWRRSRFGAPVRPAPSDVHFFDGKHLSAYSGPLSEQRLFSTSLVASRAYVALGEPACGLRSWTGVDWFVHRDVSD